MSHYKTARLTNRHRSFWVMNISTRIRAQCEFFNLETTSGTGFAALSFVSSAMNNLELEKPRILIVEDDVAAHQLLLDILSPYGAVCIAVTSVCEALSALKTSTILTYPLGLGIGGWSRLQSARSCQRAVSIHAYRGDEWETI